MKKILLLVMVFIFVIVLYFLMPNYDESSFYANKSEVIKDNAIKRGWIPKILPASAYDIKEEHNLDTNMLNGSFKYHEEDESEFLEHLKLHENIYTWEYFVFEIDTQSNIVYFKIK